MRTVLALSMLAVAAASQALMIDDFSDGNATETHSAPGEVITSTAATVPGGLRGLSNNVITNQFDLNSTIGVHSGVFTLATDPLVQTNGAFGYGFDTIGASDLNWDLSSYSAFTVDVLYNDQSADLGILVHSTTNGDAFSSAHTVGPVAFGSPVTVTIDFSELGISMNDVDAVALTVSGVPSNDIILDNFQAVPEPATIVFGLGALGALAAKRRRK